MSSDIYGHYCALVIFLAHWVILPKRNKKDIPLKFSIMDAVNDAILDGWYNYWKSIMCWQLYALQIIMLILGYAHRDYFGTESFGLAALVLSFLTQVSSKYIMLPINAVYIPTNMMFGYKVSICFSIMAIFLLIKVSLYHLAIQHDKIGHFSKHNSEQRRMSKKKKKKQESTTLSDVKLFQYYCYTIVLAFLFSILFLYVLTIQFLTLQQNEYLQIIIIFVGYCFACTRLFNWGYMRGEWLQYWSAIVENYQRDFTMKFASISNPNAYFGRYFRSQVLDSIKLAKFISSMFQIIDWWVLYSILQIVWLVFGLMSSSISDKVPPVADLYPVVTQVVLLVVGLVLHWFFLDIAHLLSDARIANFNMHVQKVRSNLKRYWWGKLCNEYWPNIKFLLYSLEVMVVGLVVGNDSTFHMINSILHWPGFLFLWFWGPILLNKVLQMILINNKTSWNDICKCQLIVILFQF